MNCLWVNKLTTPITWDSSGEGCGVIENAAERRNVHKPQECVGGVGGGQGQGWNRETGIKIHGDKKKQIRDAERAEKQKQQWNAEKVNLEELWKTWALVKAEYLNIYTEGAWERWEKKKAW